MKVMYLGVISYPKDGDNFDGLIMLERVSCAKLLTRASKNHFFTKDIYINEAIKKGELRQLIVDSITVDKFKIQMQNNYSLGGFVAERLRFSYETHTTGGNKKVVVLEEYSDIGEDFEFKYANRDGKMVE